MVADKVEVISRKAGEEKTWRWTSDGKTGFDIEEVPGESAQDRRNHCADPLQRRGQQYANGWRLQEIVRKYSNHIAFPIFLTYDKSDWDAEKKESVKTRTTEQVNAASAMWQRPKSRAEGRGLQGALQVHRDDWEDPLFWFHTARRHAGVHDAVLHSGEGSARSLPGGLQGRRQAVREARLYHGRFEGAAAAVPALRARHY